MRILEGISAEGAAPAVDDPSTVLVGVFDGVHLGHQRLLHELLELSSRAQALPTVVTFRNHPDELLQGDPVEAIVSLPHRLRLLRRAGIERVLLLDFDDCLRAMTAIQFAQRVLVDTLRTKALLLGYDSALGRDREGDPERLRSIGNQLGFEVMIGSRFSVDGEPVSSTSIRRAISAGQLEQAHRMLGRWPAAFGEVVKGDGRGRTLGYPTANVVPQSLVLPPPGVYAVEVIVQGDTLPGVANLGNRPTFDSETATPRLEVHIFDFDGDLYGSALEVAFVQRLRDGRRFASVAELGEQIRRDAAAARTALGS